MAKSSGRKTAVPMALSMPPLLVEAFDGDADLLAWVGTLRESWQREIARWVMEPKGEEARLRRADQMAERLLLTMEAEQELPAWLARRLRGTRFAMAGWERMSQSVRRDYLLVIFGARSEEARENQVKRLVETCVLRGQRQKQIPAG